MGTWNSGNLRSGDGNAGSHRFVDGLMDNDLMDTHLIRPLMMVGIPETEQEQFNRSSDTIKAYISDQMLL